MSHLLFKKSCNRPSFFPATFEEPSREERADLLLLDVQVTAREEEGWRPRTWSAALPHQHRCTVPGAAAQFLLEARLGCAPLSDSVILSN